MLLWLVCVLATDRSCQFSDDGTAGSAAVFGSSVGEKTVVLQVVGDVFSNSAAMSQLAIDAVTGQAVSPGWDTVKDTAVQAVFTAEDDSLLVFNITADPVTVTGDLLTATLPGALFASGLPLNCSNTWTIQNLTAATEELLSLYTSLNGALWTSNTGWLGDLTRPCHWHGVACINDSITGLFLNNNNLEGVLLGGMLQAIGGDIRELHLGNNKLNGSLTDLQLHAFTQIETISLMNNGITGTLPIEWGTVPTLQQIILYRNELDGTIPVEWGNITSLSTVLVHQNSLSGTLPDWGNPTHPMKHPTLKKLWAYGNNLTESRPDDDGLALQEAAFPFGPSKASNTL
eukprot:TRINITY_DN22053_c0_g1_i2.p1 TRINITY_DN22053_c0_g1~~TRINITY_DN22053_c0_g1_i2.p1  ORF type:complete len:344 (+),score=82.97 TRINITY_DN22053_c0_g1_i2:90-1121(+)